MVAFFSTVNLCIHLCSDGKLISYLVNILTQDYVIKNGYSFSTCCSVNLYIHLCSGCKLLSYLVILSNTRLTMNGCSFLHLLLCELVHSLVLSL